MERKNIKLSNTNCQYFARKITLDGFSDGDAKFKRNFSNEFLKQMMTSINMTSTYHPKHMTKFGSISVSLCKRHTKGDAIVTFITP